MKKISLISFLLTVRNFKWVFLDPTKPFILRSIWWRNMSVKASYCIGHLTVCSKVSLDLQQRNHQSFALLTLCAGNRWFPCTNLPEMQKRCPCHCVIMRERLIQLSARLRTLSFLNGITIDLDNSLLHIRHKAVIEFNVHTLLMTASVMIYNS